MATLVSTHLFRRQRLGVAQLELLQRAGADGIELFCARTSFDYHDRTQIADLAGWFADHSLRLHAVHSPIYGDEREGRSGEPPINLADPEPRRRIEALDEIRRVLDFSDRLPYRFLIQHLGPPRVEWDQRQADRALTSLERLRLLARQADITVLVENIPNALSQPQRLLAFLESSHLTDLGICFDTGHAHLPDHLFGGGGVEASWETLAPRVQSTHVHDNHGSLDEHLWPGEGTIEWEEWLRHLPASLPLVLEVGDLPANANLDLAARLRACFEWIAKIRGA